MLSTCTKSAIVFLYSSQVHIYEFYLKKKSLLVELTKCHQQVLPLPSHDTQEALFPLCIRIDYKQNIREHSVQLQITEVFKIFYLVDITKVNVYSFQEIGYFCSHFKSQDFIVEKETFALILYKRRIWFLFNLYVKKCKSINKCTSVLPGAFLENAELQNTCCFCLQPFHWLLWEFWSF